MRLKLHTAILGLLLALACAGSLWASSGEGRILGTVIDKDGNPLKGVKVTITSPDLSDYRVEMTTKKNGTFSVVFAKAYLNYNYRFELEGYQTLETTFKTNLDGTTRAKFELAEVNSVPVPSDASTPDGSLQVAVSAGAIALFNEGVAAYQAKDLATAKSKFEEALGKDPNLYQAHTALAEIYLEEGQFQLAADTAAETLAENSTDAAALRVRYDAFQKMGDTAKAQEVAEALKAAGSDTEAAKAIYNEGVDLNKAGDHAGAIAKFQQAAQMDPNLAPAYLALATLYMGAGNAQEAAAAAEKLHQLDPSNAAGLRLRRDAYTALGDDEKLRDALVDLASVEPGESVEGLFNLGIKLYNGGATKQALSMFQSAVDIQPNYAKAHYYLGLCFVNTNQGALAKEHLQRFIDLAPDDSEAGLAKEMLSYLK